MINLSTRPTNLFYSFVTDCYESVKSTVERYRAYASDYDAHQSKQYAAECNYDPFLVTEVTQTMKNLISHDKVDTTNFGKLKNVFNCLTSSVLYGAFTAVNSIRNKKMQIFVQNQPEKKMESPGPLSFESDPDCGFLVKFVECMMKDTLLLDDKTTDYDWGFVESDLSVKFESTLNPLEPPKDLLKKACN